MALVECNSNRKCFYRRTRKGKVVRLVNEKQIRNDLGCGYLCGHMIFQDKFKNIVSQAPHKQVLLIDTNIAVHQIDVLEHNCPATSFVIIIQTVLQEAKHLNLSVFHRLSALIRDESKSFIFFPNEVSSETFIKRNPGETINNANDRAIRTTAKYFQNMLEDSDGGQVVLVTNDKENQRLCQEEEGVACMSLRTYVTRFIREYPDLMDLLAADISAMNHKTVENVYSPHLSKAELAHGLQTKRLLKGTIRCRGGNRGVNCSVILHVSEGEARRSVAITGHLHVNRAIDGDTVVVQLLSPEEEAVVDAIVTGRTVKPIAVAVAPQTAEATPEAEEGLADEQTQSTVSAAVTGFRALRGRVVGILKRTWKQLAGSLDRNIMGEVEDVGDELPTLTTSAVFVPDDPKLPMVRIETRRAQELFGHKLLVAVDDWPANSTMPIGHYVRIMGQDTDKAVLTEVLLHEFGVPHEAFTSEVMACLPAADWKISETVVSQRTDCRSIPVVSIDPPGCKDIDDALHCIRKPNGNYEVGVHIADVTYFVHPGSALDKEAAHRSTSTYLVDKRLDMLPGLLTTQLCSLRSHEDHLAFTVLWEMDENANIVDVSFFKSVIHSVASLTYDQAQVMLDEPLPYADDDVVGNSVRSLNRLARILRQRRIDMGALTLASPEVRFKLDPEGENPTDVSMYALKEANALVEEFMLLANITVSKKILRHYPTLAVLRRHQPPSRDQFAPLLSAAKAVGISIDISSSKTLADSLDLAVRKDDPYFNKLLRILSTRCMMPAQYFCSGEMPKDQWHHYGLAAPVYTHFTSPIRRYADIIVHRLLASAIGVIPLPAVNADRARQRELAAHMNRRHRAAQQASRASVNLHTLMFFKGRACRETAYVLSVSADHRISVMVPRFGIEGSIDLSYLSGGTSGRTEADTLQYDPEAHILRIKYPNTSVTSQALTTCSEVAVQVFQQVTVGIKVVENSSGGRQLSMLLVVPGAELGTAECGRRSKADSDGVALEVDQDMKDDVDDEMGEGMEVEDSVTSIGSSNSKIRENFTQKRDRTTKDADREDGGKTATARKKSRLQKLASDGKKLAGAKRKTLRKSSNLTK